MSAYPPEQAERSEAVANGGKRAHTHLTLVSGRSVDLLAPSAADVDFASFAEHLAKENRFNGGTPGKCYSVAEHLFRGAEALYAATGDRAAAAAFLLHDVPEAVLKDDTTPKKQAIAVIAARFGILAETVLDAFDSLTLRWDMAIFEAAGMAFPPPPAIAALVHRYDHVMLVTEWRDLMPGPPPFAVHAEPLEGRIVPHEWPVAEARLMAAFRRFLPVFAPEQRSGTDRVANGGKRREGQ